MHRPLYDVKVNFELEELDPAQGVSVVFDKQLHNGMRLDMGLGLHDAIAWGHFEDNMEKTGWSELYMETSSDESMGNTAKTYAAGFAEGLLTCIRISEFYRNNYRLLLKKGDSLMYVKDLLKHQMSYLQEKTNLEAHVLAEEPPDPYWKHARYVLAQLWGVCDGFNYAAQHFGVHTLGLEDMALINLGGELSQLMEAYGGRSAGQSLLQFGSHVHHTNETAATAAAATPESNGDPLDDAHWERRVAETGHCSGFVRLAEGVDLLTGHTTWDDYSRMTRIFKYYKFPLGGADTMATHVGMSSYPGAVTSTDDFYILNSGLTVMETSIEVLDRKAYAGLPTFPSNPHIPGFVHVMAVNRLAKSGAHWARLFTETHQATYAAQWMAVDYNLFRPGESVPDNTLWLVEILPGAAETADVSGVLRKQGFWASMNRPYLEAIRLKSGHTAAQRSHGAPYSYDHNPRASIFAKESGNTQSLFDMRALMSRNMYNPTAAQGIGPGHDISARMDLDMISPFPNGGIDAKVVNSCQQKLMQVQAISGPSHSSLPPFKWAASGGNDLWPEWPHLGQPNVWNFGFMQMTPLRAIPTLDEMGSCDITTAAVQ